MKYYVKLLTSLNFARSNGHESIEFTPLVNFTEGHSYEF